MADIYKGLTVRLGVDDTGLSKGLRDAKKQAEGTTTELRSLEKALKLDPGNTKLLAQQQADYRKQISATEDRLKILKQAESQIGQENMSSEQWVKLQSDISLTESTLGKYRRQLSESVIQQTAMESALGKAGTALEKYGSRIKGAGETVSSIGNTMSLTVTPALVAAGVASYNLATDFESSMSRVSGALNDPSADMDELRELALKMGADTIFSATEAAAAMEELAKGGLTAADIKGGALATTMDLAAAGNLELADAANTVVQAMGAFGLTADQTGEAANALAGSAAASSADVSDLTQGLSQVSAQAHSAGWSIQDTTAVLGGFADAGIKGSDAGTSLKTMLQRLAAPTDDAAATMESLGINVRDSNGNMLDAAGVAAELQAKLGGLSSAQKDAAMQTMFGSDASRAALVMTNLGREGIEKYTAATNDQEAAQRLADAQMGESERAIEEMKGAVETAAITLGTELAPIVTDVAKAVGEAADSFGEMDEGTQRTIVAVAAVVAGLGPLLSITGKAMQGLEGLGKGIKGAAEFFAKLSMTAEKAADGTVVYTKATSKAAAATNVLGTSLKAVGKIAIVIVLTMIAQAAIDLASSLKEADDRANEIKDTNARLRSSFDSLKTGFDSTSSSLQSYSVKADEVKQKATDLVQAHSDLADSLNETMTEAGSSAGMLQSYMGVIEELGTKSNLSESEQSRLRDAVARVNEACGTSFQVTNDQNGALWGQVDAIRAVVAAQQDRLRYEAASEGLKDLYKQQESDLMRITELEQQRDALKEKMAGKNVSEVREEAEAYTETVNALGEARDSYRATSDTAKLYEERVGELGQALGSSAEEISAFASSSGAIADALSSTGQDVGAFATALSQLGISTTELSTLTDEQLAQIAGSYDGNVQSIVSKLQEFGIQAGQKGTEAASSFVAGLSAGTQQAVAAASLVTGTTVDQLAADMSKFGIEGDDAVTAYANAIANGATQTQAAAAATGTAGAQGADQSGKFDISAQSSLDAYNAVLNNASGSSEAGANVAEEANSGADSINSSGSADNWAQGFINTIGDWAKSAWDAGWNFVSNVLAGGNAAQDSNSPAKETAKMAKWNALGFVNEMKRREKDAYASGYAFTKQAVLGSQAAAKVSPLTTTSVSSMNLSSSASKVAGASGSNVSVTVEAKSTAAQLSALTNEVAAFRASIGREIANNAPVVVQTPRQAKISAREANRG